MNGYLTSYLRSPDAYAIMRRAALEVVQKHMSSPEVNQYIRSIVRKHFMELLMK
jgi:hypothetical protein